MMIIKFVTRTFTLFARVYRILSILKSKAFLKYLYLLLLLLIVNNLNGQPEFKPGYVILNNGDTLKGEIDNRGDMLMSKVCWFKPADWDTVVRYKPGNIEAYRFIDGKYYVSRQLETGKHVFLEYLINGELNVYYYRGKDGYNYYLVDKEGMPLKNIPYKEELRL
ncbi:MAG: hypothetical protein ACOC2F_09060, partial [Bacteroidota bacterium]